MKKILYIILSLIILSTFILTSCNMNIGFGHYNFKKIHICVGNVNKCIEINSWHNNEIGVEVHSKEFGSLYFSEGTYFLVENKCPICDGAGK